MEVLGQLRRTHHLIIITALALNAGFLAQGAGQLFVYRRQARDSVRATTHCAPVDPRYGERTPAPRTILERNIFDHQRRDIVTSRATMLAACGDGARLVASMHAPTDVTRSVAGLALPSGSTNVYRIGDRIAGRTIGSILPEAVVLTDPNNGSCRLSMFASANRAAPPSAATPSPAVAADPTDSRIQQASATDFRVQRSLVEQLLQHPAELMRVARVTLYEEHGMVVGVKLLGIRRQSLLAKLGLQNGDMLRTLNGFDLSSPDSALAAYAKLRNETRFSLAVVRRGSPFNIEYRIVGD